MHLKLMRTYIDGVLRFGIPPRFYMGVLKAGPGNDKKIMDKMMTIFAEKHLEEFYGEKQDAADEDFFPYVCHSIWVPDGKK